MTGYVGMLVCWYFGLLDPVGDFGRISFMRVGQMSHFWILPTQFPIWKATFEVVTQ
jgi:hypothetical protein